MLTTIQTVGTTTKYHYSVSDPLNSTDVTTDSLGNVEQLLDYYPFGSQRLNEASTTYDSARKFIGEYYDPASAMSYLNARYYDGGRGQFTSEDPTFLTIGDPARLLDLTGNEQNYFLSIPQSLNSYAYAGNNPIRYSDPLGLWYGEVALGGNVSLLGIGVALDFNDQGINVAYSAGGSLGREYPLSASFNSGDIPNKTKLQVSTGARASLGAGYGYSVEGDFDSSDPFGNGKNKSSNHSLFVGAGGSIYKNYSLSVPVYGNISNSRGDSGNNSKVSRVGNSSTQANKSSSKTSNIVTTTKTSVKSYISFVNGNLTITTVTTKTTTTTTRKK